MRACDGLQPASALNTSNLILVKARMTTIQRKIAAMMMAAGSIAVFSTTAQADETLRYDWHLRGVLSWVAGLKIPTSGAGLLQTSSADGGVHSQLLVKSDGKDYISYQ